MTQIDPQAESVLDRIARSKLPAFWDVSAAEARKIYRDTRAVLWPPVPKVGQIEDADANGIALCCYRPLGSTPTMPLPAIVFFHGGGWTVGSLDTHDIVCRSLSNAAQAAVLSVDYRLAPEHPFPAAVEDAVAATSWVADNAARLAIDPTKIAVAGDSAGGNLAAVVALALRDAKDRSNPPLAMQVLIYPAVDQRMNTPSIARLAEGYGLTRRGIEWFRAQYLPSAGDYSDWRASPLLAADHARLPPAYIITAGFDPLHDEGEAYAERLRSSGVAVTYECFEGMIHGFITMGGAIAAANHAIYRVAQALRTVFVGGRS